MNLAWRKNAGPRHTLGRCPTGPPWLDQKSSRLGGNAGLFSKDALDELGDIYDGHSLLWAGSAVSNTFECSKRLP